MGNAITIIKETFSLKKIVDSFTDSKRLNQELAFAIQAMQANNYLSKVAENNKGSLMKAIMNIALTDVSLNPVLKHAYLVPRGKEVCLDFSYRGLSQIAIDAGAVVSINTQIVRENDYFELLQGSEPCVIHKVGFGQRGEIIGCYSDALLVGGSHQIEQMSIDEIKNIQRRSPSGNGSGSSPWKTDFTEMARKTVIKRLFKYLPVPKNVMQAVQASHEANPVDFTIMPESKLDLETNILEEN